MSHKKADKSLRHSHPQIAREAHGWDPSSISHGSNKKRAWKCKKGHVWLESCNNRTQKSRSKSAGCPFCANKRVLAGFNDLKTLYPKLAKEALGWKPETVLPGTHAKKKWRCKQGHIWEAEVRTRAIRGLGCASCSGQRVIKGKTDLSTLYPKLANEADGWDPSMVKAGSSKKFRWKCAEGHSWMTSPATRTGYIKKRGKPLGCPYCSGQKLLEGFNDLATTHPKIAKEASGWNPRNHQVGSHQIKEWRCSRGHVWKARIYSRRTSGCPYCSGRMAIEGQTDLLTLNPRLAKELVGDHPEKITSKSSRILRWKCHLGHEWEASVSSRARGDGCPYCGHRRLLQGFNDLAKTHPDLALQADGWDPKSIFAGSGKKLRWKCSEGHSWINSPASRVSSISGSGKPLGCPICSGQQLLEGFNDLETLYPDLAKLAYKWNPRKVQPGSHGTKLWKCKDGHVTKSEISNKIRGLGTTNCSVCSNKQIVKGLNDLATTHPSLAKEAEGWSPRDYVAGSNSKLKWRCRLGHVWKASPNSRVFFESDCPVCTNRVVEIGFNDLATTHPTLVNQILEGDPTKVTAGSGKKFKWKCDQQHSWKAAVVARTGGTGCPSCAVSGFDPNKDGYLYYLIHPIWEMYQIGITNDPQGRISRHSKLGWQLLELRGPMEGLHVQEWETSILRMLRSTSVGLGDESIAGRFDGYTEAWPIDGLQVGTISDLMRLTEDWENSQEELRNSRR